MKLSLTTALPWWLVIFCIAAGAGIAAILYYRDKQSDFNLKTRKTLALLRGLVISLTAFLLLSPMVKTTVRRVEKPIVVLALDNSQSIVIGRDSSYYKGEFMERWRSLAEGLSKEYDIKAYNFSDNVTSGIEGDYRGKQTDISQVFDEINTRFANRNLAAVVLASDGLINKGNDPLYAAEKTSYPVITVAMGDTSQYRDLLISRVVFNQIAYLGNEFPVEISISAFKCKGNAAVLSVADETGNLLSEQVGIGSDEFTTTKQIKLKASKPGMLHFRISVTAIPGEISHVNNIRDIFIEVLDDRQKILIVSASPHPDIAALSQAVESNPDFEVVQRKADEEAEDLQKFDLVIFHQIPSMSNTGVQLLEKCIQLKIPALYILGKQSNIPVFNQLKGGLSISQSNALGDEAYAVINNDFPLFSLSGEVAKLVPQMPPLAVPFGQYQEANASEVLMYQRIGSVATRQPLILFNQGLETKTGIIAGEGLWRWRIDCFRQSGSHRAFDELISRMVQYLAVKSDKSRFRISGKKKYPENEQVTFEAELYNKSYELINTPEVKLVIIDSANRVFPFAFSRTDNAYSLNAGSFAPGLYQYEATAVIENEVMKRKGGFMVMPINVEMLHTVANHNLLYNLASQHSGKMFYPAQLDQISGYLKGREDIKSVSYSEKRYSDLVNMWWVLSLIILLLGVEWLIRKRAGSY